MRGAILLAVVCLTPLAFAAAAADAEGDQSSHAVVLIGLDIPVRCSDPGTDIVHTELLSDGTRGRIRLWIPEMGVYHSPECQEFSASTLYEREYFVTVSNAVGSSTLISNGAVGEGCIPIVAEGGDEACAGTDFSRTRRTFEWSFDLVRAPRDWCECPGWDLRGTTLSAGAGTVTHVTPNDIWLAGPSFNSLGWGLPHIEIRDSSAEFSTVL